MATLGTATSIPRELFVTFVPAKGPIGTYSITDQAVSSASIRYSATDLSKREQLVTAALMGLCARGEGSNPSLSAMAIKYADDLAKALEGK